MNTWSAFPFLRITGAFIIGLLIAKFQVVLPYAYLPWILSCLVIVFLILQLSKVSGKLWMTGNVGLLIILLVGLLRYHDSREINDPSHIIHGEEFVNGYKAIISSASIEKEKYFVYQTDMIKVFSKDTSINKTGKVQLYVWKNDLEQPPLNYGDEFLVSTKPFRLPPPKNPHEFNYQAYKAGQNIYYQQFLDFNNIKIIGNNPKYSITQKAYVLRTYFAEVLKKHIKGSQELAIAKALILGIKDGLDNDIKRSYSATGAMHVLAVSGLHVGIIIVISSFLLAPIRKRKYGKFVALGISLALLWAFAMITGLSPSILRAVTMFSIIIIGQAFQSRSNIYNSLALSAFILLFANPNFLFTVGFQLSYIAVIGIVYIYPKIHSLLIPSGWIFEKIWSISCISIAAQLATFPLTLYYFHQFPVYFLISNLVVIPAAFIVMNLGLALLVFGSTTVAPMLGTLLEYLIYGLNSLVSSIEQLNFSLIDWLYLSPSQTLIIYAMIIALFGLLHYRKLHFMYSLLFLAIVISSTGVLSLINQYDTKKLIFYEIGGEAVFDKIDGLDSELICINKINNHELIRFQVEPNRLNNLLGKVEELKRSSVLHKSNHGELSYFNWAGKKFVFIRKPIDHLELSDKIQTDYLVISNNSVKDIDLLSKNFNFSQIIIDSSNDYFTCRQFEKTPEAFEKKCRILRNESALTISI